MGGKRTVDGFPVGDTVMQIGHDFLECWMGRLFDENLKGGQHRNAVFQQVRQLRQGLRNEHVRYSRPEEFDFDLAFFRVFDGQRKKRLPRKHIQHFPP